eukprot:359543-Chlamydomonas_euryale.AAC.6
MVERGRDGWRKGERRRGFAGQLLTIPSRVWHGQAHDLSGCTPVQQSMAAWQSARQSELQMRAWGGPDGRFCFESGRGGAARAATAAMRHMAAGMRDGKLRHPCGMGCCINPVAQAAAAAMLCWAVAMQHAAAAMHLTLPRSFAIGQ